MKILTEQDTAEAIEKQLKMWAIPVAQFLVKCEVSSSTWHRTINGTTVPNGRTMRRINIAFENLKTERLKQSADAKPSKD